MQVNPKELDKLPYYQNKPADGRAAVVWPFETNGELYLPMPNPSTGEIVILKPVLQGAGSYFAKALLDPVSDAHIPFLELFLQRLSFPRPMGIVHTVVNDLLNFGAVLEKHDLIFRDYSRSPDVFRGHLFLIGTELEYLFYNIRSLYDQLHFVMRVIWEETESPNRQVRINQLPKSFADVAFEADDRLRNADAITRMWGLPAPLAGFYQEQGDFFGTCRAIRDRVAHGGMSLSSIYYLDKGFAVDATEYPYSAFDCWPDRSLRNGKLGSVRALIAHIADRSIGATSAYADALQACIRLPDPIAPDWHIYVRGPYVSHLHRLSEYLDHPWVDKSNDG